ncbi:hypothetical protein HE1_01242 [Holospora elegans E1]|uniref:Uncharacterized protein n=1 Tax=Holospora elegans E1 TaxID=1427503 RepID=A0A023E0R2_9PROT|nr:hypothetical protein HE1_01242 [Holospora elegans E1]
MAQKKKIDLRICQERMGTLIKASGVMALMTGVGTNAIDALISKYNCNWFDILLSQYRGFYILGAEDFITKPSKRKR